MSFFKRKKKKNLDVTNVAPEPKITEFFIGIPGYYIDTDKEVNTDIPEHTEYIYYNLNSLYIRILTSEICSIRNQESCNFDESISEDSLCDEIYNNVIEQLTQDESVNVNHKALHELTYLKGSQYSYNETPTIHIKAPTKDTNLFQNELEKIKINLKNEIDTKNEKQQLESENQKIIGNNKDALFQKLQIEYYSAVSQVAAENSSFKPQAEKSTNKELEKQKKKALRQAQKDEKRLQKKLKKQEKQTAKQKKEVSKKQPAEHSKKVTGKPSGVLHFSHEQSVGATKIEKEVV